MNAFREFAPLCRTRSTLAKVVIARLWLRLGGYADARAVDWGRVSRLVFVCTGNICRSPYAEFKVRAQGVPSASFGLRARRGLPADPVAQDASRARGVELSAARTSRMEDVTLGASDLIIAMEPWQYREVAGLCERFHAQRTLLGVWGGINMPWLPDPYLGPRGMFDQCYALIDQALPDLVSRATEPVAGPADRVVG